MAKSYPASFQQRQFCWLQSLDPGSSAYSVPMIFTIEGTIHIPVLKQSFSKLINENDILRTTFFIENNNYSIESTDKYEDNFESVDMTHESAQSIMDFVDDFIRKPFDLKKGPLYRTMLIRNEENSYIWCLVFQHSVCDLRTKDLICSFISESYNSLLLNKEPKKLDDQVSAIRYGKYAQMQHEWVLTEPAAQSKKFWGKTLAEIPVSLSLPTDFQRPSCLQQQGTAELLEFDEVTTAQIKAFSKQYEVTPFLCLFTAYAVMLSRYGNQEQFIIGVPFTNRRNPSTQDTMGCFVNTLPIPVDLRECNSMVDCMKVIRKTMLLAHRNQELPTEIIIKEVNKNPPSLDRNPLYQVGFTFEPLSNLSLIGCTSQHRYVHHGGSQLDLFATFWEDGDTIQGAFEYNYALFSSETIQHWLCNFSHLVRNFLEHPDNSVQSTSLIDSAEQRAIDTFSKSQCSIDNCDASFIDLFLKQVTRDPSKIALHFDNKSISYIELNTMSNSIALHLNSAGIGQGHIIGVLIDRSVEMLAALIGILKAGAGYLPIDPDFPKERIRFILEDSNVKKVIINSKYDSQIFFERQKTVLIENLLLSEEHNTQTFSQMEIAQASAAYMIYTSGSTGNPKGVVINHGNLSNFIASMINEPGIAGTDRMLAITTISFDIHILELLVPLTVGATIVLAPRESLGNGTELIKLIDYFNVSIMQATPVTWKLLCSAGWKGSCSFKALCGGEAMSQDLAKQLLPRCGFLYNMYGPTETTVWSTCYRITDCEGQIPIGTPIANTTVRIVDKWGNTAPLGTWGELWIGGAGVANGYHNRSELTEKKFRNIPGQFGDSQKFYVTGDICRIRRDGIIEYSSRSDDQIKIRGYRIELEEIERVIETHPEIASAAVVVHGTQDSAILVAFIVLKQIKENFNSAVLKEYLHSKLPEYMIPVRFVDIPSIPLTPNKKIDRKVLKIRDISLETIKLSTIGLSAKNDIETKLIEIWATKLHLEFSNVDTNFFDVGGNSLLLLQLKEHLQLTMTLDVPVTTLLRYSTIRSLSQHLQEKTQPEVLLEMQDRASLQKKAMRSAVKRFQHRGKT